MYKDFVKQSSADNMQSLNIAVSSTYNASSNNLVIISPEDRYCDSNEWYALSKNDKDKFLKARSNIN